MTNPTIQKLIDKFEKYSGVKYSHTDDTITFKPKDEKGFAVTLGVGPRDIIVSSDFWREHFDKDEEDKALNCFAFMLSDSCRLRIDYKGEKPKSWTIESWENGNWASDSTTGLFSINFWSPTRTEYLQNDLIKTRVN
jgi:hypothetical protein